MEKEGEFYKHLEKRQTSGKTVSMLHGYAEFKFCALIYWHLVYRDF